jgi:hypothetical protein
VAADCQLGESAAGPWQEAGALIPTLKGGDGQPASSSSAPQSQSSSEPFGGAWYASQPTSTPDGAGRYVAPHRAPLVLVLGILGLLMGCPIFSAIAWIMGSQDIREMRAGRMDRSGEGATQAGMVLGMVVGIFWLLMAFAFLAIALIAIVANL